MCCRIVISVSFDVIDVKLFFCSAGLFRCNLPCFIELYTLARGIFFRRMYVCDSQCDPTTVSLDQYIFRWCVGS